MTLEQIGGAVLMLLFLADIFLTVLYARAGTGVLAPRWNRLIWALIKAISRPFGRRRSAVLSFAGPLIVVALIGFWALGLTAGAALVIRPELGTAIRPSSGDTPTDFVTALLVAGSSLSIVGGGDYSPHTSDTRLLFLLNSLIGASVLSLVLSYLVQVYSALQERNALALNVDLLTGGKGDAAEMLARLGPGGDFSDATSELSNLARSLATIKEAHHFYPLLFYFRFSEPRYAVSRFSFVLLDLTTLIDTSLDQHKYGTLVRAASVGALRRCALLLLQTLDRHFPNSDDERATGHGPSYEESYAAALATMRGAGITIQPDNAAYAEQRSGWDPLIRRVALELGYDTDEIQRRWAPF
ncbi:ion channel [Novosphingobium sp. 9U]|uniref:ion channel n=1 Tax=Novosphingobium sp. 9U TaxID=2653158 RepID=UPI0012EF4131|nr:ion channel [Novosphingobium sp. 9U]VWX51142.1 Two pore domain potassium channel family protein [Novosphingobium sp. 9U]